MRLRLVFIYIMAALLIVSCGHKDHQTAGGHEEHGDPKNWKFTLMKGDANDGRKLFVELECYKCHEVKGEKFPDLPPGDKGIGPELSHMGGEHTIEFLAESIINPNAVIDDDAKKQGYVGEDAKSKMPSYGDVLTVKQLSDLATYLASLGGGHKH
jgi:mono/diheme cytochrome c family protein